MFRVTCDSLNAFEFLIFHSKMQMTYCLVSSRNLHVTEPSLGKLYERLHLSLQWTVPFTAKARPTSYARYAGGPQNGHVQPASANTSVRGQWSLMRCTYMRSDGAARPRRAGRMLACE